jgi:hypothetical protein
MYASDDPAPELSFLSNPGLLRVYIGRDAMPTLSLQKSPTGEPFLNNIVGWHVQWALDGLDVLESWQYAGLADGTIACETELARFFNSDPLPRYHVQIAASPESGTDIAGSVTKHDGHLVAGPEGIRLEDISNLTWTCRPIPHNWMAVAINRVGRLPTYSVSVNGSEVKDGKWLAKDIPGYGQSMWDIFLVPPKYIEGPSVDLAIGSPIRGSIIGIFWVQRNYPDSQYRDWVARPLGLEFSDIDVLN